MTWQNQNGQSLLAPDIQKFIRAHEKDDVAALALKKPPNPDWDYKAILDQIKARQKASKKTPGWLEHDEIIFPPGDILEQASSAATARYKAGLVKGESFADLTGGTGVDSWAFTENFKRGIVIERDEHAAALINHNLKILSQTPIEVLNIEAENFVKTMPEADLTFIDPQRRDTGRKGKFKFEDCSPDILTLLPVLLKKSGTVMIKTSPMLDIAQGIAQLGMVTEVHIVEWRGDCKELLFILKRDTNQAPKINAVSLDDNGEVISMLSFTQTEEQDARAEISMPLKYLYEPGPAFQKSGGFNTIATQLDVKKIHTHTHLYTSDTLIEAFPGRIFKIQGSFPAKIGKMPLKKANITTRNFPMPAESLRKKLKIKDGGDDYLFACTLMDETKILLHGQKP